MLSDVEFEALFLSLKVAGVAVAASLPFGVALGWLLARKSFWGKSILETVVNLPLVLPPVVTGWGLLMLFGTQGVLGGILYEWLGIRIVFDWKGAALAAAVVGFPLLVRSVRLSISMVDRRYEEVARTLGAAPLDVFFSVTLPLSRRGVVAGSVLAFARAMGEFGATIMIAGSIAGETRTIPLYVYQLLETPGGAEAAWRIVVVSVAIAALALIISEAFERRTIQELEGVRT
ncbi:MAG: molybdate ABC transporter permease subunit [Planctomycetes bacterium]|nr:molybdate ABC transporter permease subunit [Planctomycetota bacterium]